MYWFIQCAAAQVSATFLDCVEPIQSSTDAKMNANRHTFEWQQHFAPQCEYMCNTRNLKEMLKLREIIEHDLPCMWLMTSTPDVSIVCVCACVLLYLHLMKCVNIHNTIILLAIMFPSLCTHLARHHITWQRHFCWGIYGHSTWKVIGTIGFRPCNVCTHLYTGTQLHFDRSSLTALVQFIQIHLHTLCDHRKKKKREKRKKKKKNEQFQNVWLDKFHQINHLLIQMQSTSIGVVAKCQRPKHKNHLSYLFVFFFASYINENWWIEFERLHYLAWFYATRSMLTTKCAHRWIGMPIQIHNQCHRCEFTLMSIMTKDGGVLFNVESAHISFFSNAWI